MVLYVLSVLGVALSVLGALCTGIVKLVETINKNKHKKKKGS